MLQNDIPEENDNDGFIIPMTPIMPGVDSTPTSPLSPRRTRPRGMSTNALTSCHTGRSDERFISFEHFRTRYWNHLPQSITRVLGTCTVYLRCNISNWGLDPALVFGEILGVIKGSEKTVGTRHRCLDRDTYSSGDGQGISRQGILSHTKEAVYDLFTAYTKLKRQHQEYDAADRSAPPECSPDGKSLSSTAGHITY